MSLDDYLVQLSKEGLEKRLEQLYPDAAEREAQRETYYQRLEFECGTIIKMGFPGYFLIVRTLSTGPRTTACRSVRAGVRAQVRWSRMRSA
jgi:DNA polymerase III, alpha subunit